MNLRSRSIAPPISSDWAMSPAAAERRRCRGPGCRCARRAWRRAARSRRAGRSSVRDHPGAQRVVDVVVDVGDAVDDPDDPALERRGLAGPVWLRMPSRTGSVRFRPAPSRSSVVDHAQRVLVVLELAAEALPAGAVERRPRRCGRTAGGRGRGRARSPRSGPR